MSLTIRPVRLGGLGLLSLVGCENGQQVTIDEYLTQELPAWEDATPQWDAGQTPIQFDEPSCAGRLEDGGCVAPVKETTVPLYGDAGAFLGYGEQAFECTTKRYSITSTPETMVMLNPDVELLWPGALLQGKSLSGDAGVLLPLPIRQRAPLKISIPALAVAENYREVEHPELATVEQAIGDLVSKASEQHLKAPSTISFTMRTYNSEEEFALSVGLSAKYLGFRASASTSINRSSAERTVAVMLREKMFEVVVEPPQTAEAFFSAEFTPELLEDQKQRGRIGADNLPIYVSNVVYGRLMMFTFTSKASETEIRAALNASYRGLFSASVSVASEYKKVLSEGRVAIMSLGGDSAATSEMIAIGDWRAYFRTENCTTPAVEGAPISCTYETKSPPLTTAAPLSYTFRRLADGLVAKVSERTSYEVRECVPDPSAGVQSKFVASHFDTPPASGDLPQGATEGWHVVGVDAGAPTVATSATGCRLLGCLGQRYTGGGPWYFVAPDSWYLGELDWFGGELSYWMSHDPVPTSDAGVPLGQQPVYDVVLKAGAPESQMTLVWAHQRPSPILAGSHRFSVPFAKRACTNEPIQGSALSYLTGCWTLAGERAATDNELEYAVDNVTQLMIRGSLDTRVQGAANTYLDEVQITAASNAP